MVKKCLLLAMMFSCCAACMAADNYWVGGSSGSWHTASNWSAGHVPVYNTDGSEKAYIGMNATSDYTIEFTSGSGSSASPGDFYLGRSTLDPAGTYTLNVASTGYFYNASSYIGSKGIINIDQGGEYCTLGTKGMNGVVNINGGIYRNRSYVWRIGGYVTINPGGQLLIGNGTRFSESSSDPNVTNSYFTGVIDLCGGRIRMQNDCTTALTWHINNGNIIAFGGTGSVVCSYDATENITEITPVINYWTGAGDGVSWHDDDNWSSARAPIYNTDGSEIAYLGMNATSDYTVEFTSGGGADVSPGDFYLGRSTLDPAGTYTLDVESTGSFYNVYSYIGSKGVINVNGGNYITFGTKGMSGTVNIDGGTYSNRSYIWRIDGYITVNAGGEFLIGNGTRFSESSSDITVPNSYFTGVIDLCGGEMRMQGDCTTALRWHVYNGNIIAYGNDPDYGIVVNYDSTEDKTHVYADTAGTNCTFYYDADTSNTWTTALANYQDLSDWSYTSPFSVVQNMWYRKTGSDTAFNGNVFQGVGAYLPQLTTTITGIDSLKKYDVYVVFHARNVDADWYIYAGMPGELLQLYDETNSTILRNNTLITCQAKIGTISGSNSVSINVDGPISSGSNDQRAWYDGVALVEVPNVSGVTLTATPSIVKIPINEQGSTTISWPASGVSTVSLYKSVNQAPETNIDSYSGLVSDSNTVNDINRDNTYDFNLYAGPDNTYQLLGSVRVEGYKLMRANEYCSVPSGGSGHYKVSFGPAAGWTNVQLYRSINGGAEEWIDPTQLGNAIINKTFWIGNGVTHRYRLYGGISKDKLLDECLVTGRMHMPSEQSEYLSLTSDAVITKTTTLLSKEIYISGNVHDVYVQSDGSFYPDTISTNNDTYSIYITVDGERISNKSGIRWYSSTDPGEHCFNCIGLIKDLASGTHKFELIAEHSGGDGIFLVGADSNLSIMIDPASESIQSTDPYDSQIIDIDTDNFHNDGILLTETITSHNFGFGGRNTISMISGSSFYAGGTGDAFWAIHKNGSTVGNTEASRTVNDIWGGAELYAPMYAHAYFSGSTSDIISFEASEYPWTLDKPTQYLRYRVQGGARLISLSGAMSVSGTSVATQFEFGSTASNATHPVGDDELLTSEDFTIPSGHNGHVLFTAKARCLGDDSNLDDNIDTDGDGIPDKNLDTYNLAHVYYWIEIDGQPVGSMGIQQFGERHCGSQRTLCASYFAAGDDALSEGTHTVDLYCKATLTLDELADPNEVDIEKFTIHSHQLPLLWFD